MYSHLKKDYTALERELGFYFGRLLSYPLIPPEHAYFSVTNRCNLKCIMCDVARESSKIEDELSISQIKDIILQIKAMKIKHLIFSGGEPFLKEDLLEAVELSTNNIDTVDIITNGILLADDIIQKLIKIRLNHITISLDGLKENNDRIRGKGVFDKAMHNIERIKYYKYKYSSSYPTVGINFTIMDQNICDILPMIDFARENKFNSIVFQPLLFSNTNMQDRNKDILWPSEHNVLRLKGIVERLSLTESPLGELYICTDAAVLEALPGYFMGVLTDGAYKCYEAIKRIVISCDGTVWSCRGVYGDLRQNSLEKIWLSEEASRVRKSVKVCKDHCLQDCIYSSSDILEELIMLSENDDGIKTNAEEIAKEKIFRKLDEYVKLLYKNNK